MLSVQLRGHATMEQGGVRCVLTPGGIGLHSADLPGVVVSSDDYRSLCLTQPSLDFALDVVDAAIEDILGRGFTADRVVLWAFSQGACLLAHHCLTRPRSIGGLVLFTGGYVGADPVVAKPHSPAGVPVIMRSVELDPFVPSLRVLGTTDAVRSAGAEVKALIVPGEEHIITDEAIDSARALLARKEFGSPTS